MTKTKFIQKCKDNIEFIKIKTQEQEQEGYDPYHKDGYLKHPYSQLDIDLEYEKVWRIEKLNHS